MTFTHWELSYTAEVGGWYVKYMIKVTQMLHGVIRMRYALLLKEKCPWQLHLRSCVFGQELNEGIGEGCGFYKANHS